MTPQRTAKKASPEKAVAEASPEKAAVACDNHPDRGAVVVTDGKAFQELHLCAACVPPGWDKDD